MTGIYIHIPFCKRICPYCDFATQAPRHIPQDEYCDSLVKELGHYCDNEFFSSDIETIYFGGGTPSILSEKNLEKVLSSIRDNYKVSKGCEITFELNPEHGTKEYARALKNIGVSRISCGVQSLNPRKLKFLGRRHSREQVVQVINNLRSLSFSNISLDLIFNIADETINELREDINSFIDLNPEHISTYELTIEKGTPFFTQHTEGKFSLPSEGQTLEMMELISDVLNANGYLRYEISNYSRPDFESRHNSSYWSGENVLGIGAGAHSYYSDPLTNSGKRFSNIINHKSYIEKIYSNESIIAWSENLDSSVLLFEFIILPLRTSKGVNFSKLEKRFGKELCEQYSNKLYDLIKSGFAKSMGDKIVLTPKGINVYDSIVKELI